MSNWFVCHEVLILVQLGPPLKFLAPDISDPKRSRKKFHCSKGGHKSWNSIFGIWSLTCTKVVCKVVCTFRCKRSNSPPKHLTHHFSQKVSLAKSMKRHDTDTVNRHFLLRIPRRGGIKICQCNLNGVMDVFCC